ncbi:MAG: sarcosine oxidase subunit gamma family protein [Gammaproteobacteria bacterium]
MSDSVLEPAARRGAELVQFAGLLAVPPLARFSLRGELPQLANALQAARVPVSQTACRAVEGEICAALWLGPDEQLLLAPEPQAARLVEILHNSLATVAHSVVDISHRQTAFEIAGPSARMLLNTGCPLDLADGSFPVGMCTRTLFEKSEIVLWRTAADTFHVEVWRSFAPYVTGLLARGARELGGGQGVPTTA